jgi:hypothetical protein
MNRTEFRPRLIVIGQLVAGVTAFSASVSAEPVDLAPNLRPFPAADFSLVSTTSGTSTLRFSTTSWNNGTGPLELVAGEVETGSGKQKVYQRIYLSDGTAFLHLAGSFTYHATHNHMHFDDYALYTLQPVDAPGGSALTGSKVTFCVMDTTKVNTQLPGAPPQAVYATCGNLVQGMSVGWGDTYGSHLPGQEIDFTDAPDGIYQLKIEIDPKHLLIEADETDNVSCALVRIQKPSTVTLLDSSGSCSAVTSITPNAASMGTTIQVTIGGFGFTQDSSVSFERGNGPRPVASNIVLTSDTDGVDVLSATITVPFKKQLGRDPVWDVRVGNSVFRDAFRVTR